MSNPVESTSPTLAVQRIGDRYLVLGLVGTGGMGTVYRAHDVELGEVVALKFLRKELTASPEMLDRFRQEVRLARRVTHRNVARTFDIGEHDGQKFLSMEYVDGESLSRLLAREGALPPARAAEIAVALCEALAAAHAAGVVHRDLKPDNVLIEASGRVVVTDFGVARAAFDAPSGLTQGPLGTPAYMAPEQVEGVADVDGRADLYALGAVLYEMLTGSPAWSGGSPFVLAVRRLTDPPPDPRTVASFVPDALADIVKRLLARRREDRYTTASEAAAALNAARDVLPTTVAAPTTTAVRAQRVAPSPGERTVAVLPFRNLGAPEDDELADALTDDLVDALSVTRGLRVRPRRLVARRAVDDDLQALGRALDVEVVVEGTLRRSGEAVRIVARVQSCAEGLQLWAGRFHRPARDLLAINDEVAGEVAQALTGDREGPSRKAPTDSMAVDLYLRARRALARGWSGLGDLEAAVTLFEQGLDRAPENPSLLAGLAMALARRLNVPSELPPEPPDRARALAEKAVALAPEQPEPWLALGTLHHITSAWPLAVTALRQALHRAPGLIEAHKLLATIQLEVGQADEALFRLETVLTLDPTLAEVRTDLARGNALLGRWERADRFLDIASEDAGVSLGRDLARARLALWRRGEAPDVEWPSDGRPAAVLGRTLETAMRTGNLPAPGMQLLDAGIARSVPGSRLRPLLLQVRAELRAWAGDREAALDSIEQAVASGLYDVLWLDRCPLFDAVRRHPRFAIACDAVAQRAGEVVAALTAPLG